MKEKEKAKKKKEITLERKANIYKSFRESEINQTRAYWIKRLYIFKVLLGSGLKKKSLHALQRGFQSIYRDKEKKK